MSLVEVIGPSSPVRGLNTSLAGPYVPPGYFEALDNLRMVTGYVMARNGSQVVASAGVPSSGITYGGSETFIQDGTTKIVRVVRETSSGKSDIYVSSDGGANYTKITATSGPYGDTRLNQLSDLQATFALVNDRSSFGYGGSPYDCLVIQSGNDAPLVYAKMNIGGYTPGNYGLAKVNQIDAPTGIVVTAKQYDAVGNYFDFTGASFTNSAPTHFTGTYLGGIYLSASNLVAANDKVTVDFGSNYDFSAALLLVCNFTDRGGPGWTTSEPLFNDLQCEIGDSLGHWWTLFNGGTASASAAYVTLDSAAGTVYQMGFTFNENITFDETKCRYLRFTYTGTGVTGIAKCLLNGFGISGTTYDGGDFAVAFMGEDFRTIGPSEVGPAPKTAYVEYGTGSNSATWIYSSLFPWNYTVTCAAPSAGMVSKGVNYALLFIRPNSVGDTYYYTGIKDDTATYSGSWSASAAPAFAVNSTYLAIDYSLPAPPASALCLQGGSSYNPMAVANGRLFVGSQRYIYFSEYERPFQFTSIGNAADNSSGGKFSCDGETPYGIVTITSVPTNAETLGAPQIGSAEVFLVLQTKLVALNGWDYSSLIKRTVKYAFGTESPGSISVSRQGFYWLTNEKQIAFWDGAQGTLLSKNIVDKSLATMPADRIRYADSAVVGSQYYLAYTPSGSSNSKMLIYDESNLAFVTDTPPLSRNYEGLMSYKKNGLSTLYAFTNDGKNYTHDEYGQTTDSGTAIPVSITPRELNADAGKSVSVKNVRFTSSVAAAGTMTVTRSARGNKTITDSVTTMSLATAGIYDGSRIVRHDSGTNFGGIFSDAVSVNFAAGVSAAWTLFRVAVNVDYIAPDSADA